MAGITVGGGWALYVVAMNIFLSTRLVRDLVSEDEASLLVDYASAYSVVPGRVHVRDLRIRGRDSNIEWILVLEQCDFRVWFRDLLRRRFHADDVHGNGVSFRGRLRKPSFTADVAAALPPVPGFSDPPYSGVKPAPIPDANYRLWSIRLEGVLAEHVHEIWVDTIRFVGDFDVRGRWYFKPMRWLEVGPAAIAVRSLGVSHGTNEDWVRAAHGHFEVTVHPSDVRGYDGLKVLDDVSLAGDIVGLGRGTGPLDRALEPYGVAVEEFQAPFGAHLVVEHGVLRPASSAHVDSFLGRMRGRGVEFETHAWAEIAVDGNGVGRLRIEARASRASLGTSSTASVQRAALVLRSSDLDLARPFGDADYAVDIEDLATDSLKPWIARLGPVPGFDVNSGRALLTAHVAGVLSERSLTCHAQTEIRALSLKASGVEFAGGVRANVDARVEPDQRAIELSGVDIVVTTATFATQGLAVTVPKAVVTSDRANITRAGVRGRAEVDVPNLVVPALDRVAALLPLPAGVGVEGGHAIAHARLRVDLGERAADGVVRVAARGVIVRIGGGRLRGDVDVAVRASHDAGPVMDVSGTTFRFHEVRREGWWASADLRDARLTIRNRLALRAGISVLAKDAGPVASLLARHAALPARVALGVISTANLFARGDVMLTPSVFEARSVVVDADGFDVNLEAATLGAQRDLAVYVRAGPLRVGIDVANDRTDVKLFDAEPWFSDRVAAMRAAERRYE